MDCLLSVVLGRNTGVHAGVHAGVNASIASRLDSLERALVSLTLPWRSDVTLAPARELRLSSATLATLLQWLEGSDRPDWREMSRLGVYASGALTDEEVPEGWLRIRLA